MPVTQLNYQLDQTGHCSYSTIQSNLTFQVTLNHGVIKSITVPDYLSNGQVDFSYFGASRVWISIGGTPSLPTDEITQCACEMNPAQRAVKAGQVISMVTGNTEDDVGICFYSM